MSTYLPDSELSLINASMAADWIPVSETLFEVLAAADRISRATSGAFDITVGRLVNLWGFGPGGPDQQIPPANRISDALQATGYRQIELRPAPPSLRKLNPRIYLDLSGIAPGYAADRIADFLEDRDIYDYLVDISGEIRARGENRLHQAWRVGIERPLPDGRAVQRIIRLEGTGMTTSGDYRNFFVREGRRYSHTIDPATGWPIAHELTSVTVIDRSAMDADALDTAFMVMGPERAWQFAEEHNIPAFFIINRHGEFIERYTTPFSAYLVK
jgi:thiamine biosynthesis lipoprotein